MEHMEHKEDSVKTVYEIIADEFDQTRHSVWRSVKKYLDSLESGSKILEIGCGNGKNMLYRKDLDFYGIDFVEKFIEIIHKKGLKGEVMDMREITFEENTFDHIIMIASYHHLETMDERVAVLNHIKRILKPNGTCLITVWSDNQPKDSRFKFDKRDTQVKWVSRKTGEIFSRYYRIYFEGDFEKELMKTELVMVNKWEEKGNRNFIIKKHFF